MRWVLKRTHQKKNKLSTDQGMGISSHIDASIQEEFTEEELNIAPEDLKESILQETTNELPEIVELKVLIGTLRQQVQMLFPQILKRAYDAQDNSSQISSIPRNWPVKGYLTSRYGYRRHPITKKITFHNGIDIAAPLGTQIIAPASGSVIYSGEMGGYGQVIELDHGYGIVTRFAHNSKLFVIDGQQVKLGDVIASIGSSGRSTGPHLHYEIRIDGISIDPMTYLPP